MASGRRGSSPDSCGSSTPREVTIVVNTGDDERIRGLHVSPDIDTVLYHLAGATDWERGWGLDDEILREQRPLRAARRGAGDLGVDLQEWFALGDRDLATHHVPHATARRRTHARPRRPTRCVARSGVSATVLPMSDDPVRTMLRRSGGERLDFQTYFVRRAHADADHGRRVRGADVAKPAPGVLDAIASG